MPHANNDGDSFHVRCGDDAFVVRLYFVDAPETNLLIPDRVREQAEHFGATLDDTLKAGARARVFVRESLKGTFTVVTRKASAPGRAKDPRYYGMVVVEGRGLDEMLVLQGLSDRCRHCKTRRCHLFRRHATPTESGVRRFASTCRSAPGRTHGGCRSAKPRPHLGNARRLARRRDFPLAHDPPT